METHKISMSEFGLATCHTMLPTNRPQRLPSQKKMTRTHQCSTPPDATSRQRINSNIHESSKFISALYCASPIQIDVLYRQSAWRTFTTYRCLCLCLVLKPEREMSRWMNSGRIDPFRILTGGKGGSVTRTSDDSIITRDSIH